MIRFVFVVLLAMPILPSVAMTSETYLAPLHYPGTEVDGMHVFQEAKRVAALAVDLNLFVANVSPALERVDRNTLVREILINQMFIIMDQKTNQPAQCFRKNDSGESFELELDYITGVAGSIYVKGKPPKILFCRAFFDSFEMMRNMVGDLDQTALVAYKIWHEIGHPLGYPTAGGSADGFAYGIMCEYPALYGSLCDRIASSIYIDTEDLVVDVLWELAGSATLELDTSPNGYTTQQIKRSIKSELSFSLNQVQKQSQTLATYPARETLLRKFTDIRYKKNMATHTLLVEELSTYISQSVENPDGECQLDLKTSVVRNLDGLVTDRSISRLYVGSILPCVSGNVNESTITQLINIAFSKLHSTSERGRAMSLNISPEVPLFTLSLDGTFPQDFSVDVQGTIDERLQPAIGSWQPAHDSAIWEISNLLSVSRQGDPGFLNIRLNSLVGRVTDEKVSIYLGFLIEKPVGETLGKEATTEFAVNGMSKEEIADSIFIETLALYERKVEEMTIDEAGRICEFAINAKGDRFTRQRVSSMQRQKLKEYKDWLSQARLATPLMEKVRENCIDLFTRTYNSLFTGRRSTLNH